MLANQMPALYLQSGRAGLQRFILSKKVELCLWPRGRVCLYILGERESESTPTASTWQLSGQVLHCWNREKGFLIRCVSHGIALL